MLHTKMDRKNCFLQDQLLDYALNYLGQQLFIFASAHVLLSTLFLS